jgi:hypothetical protein
VADENEDWRNVEAVIKQCGVPSEMTCDSARLAACARSLTRIVRMLLGREIAGARQFGFAEDEWRLPEGAC